MPNVSVVMPVYNVERYLEECLGSIIRQTLKDLEIICVNDGSKDGSLAILERYAEKDKRIKIITKKNSGYGHTMNVGIDAATGEYIGIVEPDDYIGSNMYEELYKTAKANDADIVKADFYRFVKKGNEVFREYNQISKWEKYYNRIIDPTDELEVFRFIMNTWSGIYKATFLRENKIKHNETPGASFQDNGFWFQGFCLSHRIYFVDRPYYMNRRDNPNSSVHDKTKVYCANTEYDFIKKFLLENSLYEHFKYVYTMKKWHNYWFTYNRIGKEHKTEYLKNIGAEIKKSFENGEIKKEYFSGNEIKAMKLIASKPLAFHYMYKIIGRLKAYVK